MSLNYKIEVDVKDAKARLDELNQKFDELGKSPKQGAEFFEELQDQVDEAKEALEELSEQIETVAEEVEKMPLGPERDEATRVLNQLREEYSKLQGNVAEAEGAIEAFGKQLLKGKIYQAAFMAAAYGISKAIEAITEKAREISGMIAEGFEAANKELSFQLSAYLKAQSVWKAANGDVDKLNDVLTINRDILDETGISINTINDGNQAFIDKTPGVIDAIKQRAMAFALEKAAQVAASEAAAQYLQAEEEIADKQNQRQNNWFRKTYEKIERWAYFGDWSDEEYQEMLDNEDRAIRHKYEKKANTYIDIAQNLIDQATSAFSDVEKKFDSLGLKSTSSADEEVARKKLEAEAKRKQAEIAAQVAELQARKEVLSKEERELLRRNEDMQNVLRQAKINGIENTAEREFAQMELDHKKRLQLLDREKEDYIEKLKEKAVAEYRASTPKGDYVKFAREWELTAEQKKEIDDYYNELVAIAEKAYYRSKAKLEQAQQSSRISYMKDSGIMPLVKEAIEKEYEVLMNEAAEKGDTWKWLQLNKEKKEKIWQAENASRIEYLTEYGDIREKELAITQKYDHLIEKEQDEFRKKILEQQKKTELFNLERQKGGKFYNIFRDTDRMNIVQITDAIQLAEDTIKELSEDAAGNADKIEALRSALENLKKAANDFSAVGILRSLFSTDKDNPEVTASLKSRIEGLKKAWTEMGEDARAKAVGGWASGIANSLGKAASYMKQVADASGDPRLSNAAEQLSSVAQNFSAAGQGAASGGWVGAIVAGVLDIFGQISEGIVNSEIQEIEATRYAKRWEDALADVSRKMQEVNYYSPFGERSIAKGREGARAAIESLNQYENKLKEIKEYYGINGGLADQLDIIYGGIGNYRFDEDWVNKHAREFGLGSGLSSAAVVTKHRKWGRDSVSSLQSLYPDLFDNNGEIIIDNVKKLLEAESYLNSEQNSALREQLENLVKMKEEYDAAIKAIDDSISDTFGQLASSITDVIWDSVMNGADAWEQFGKVGSDVITALGKQLIQEMVISTYLDNFKEDMRKAYMLESGTDTQTELRRIMGDIFGGLQTVLESGSEIAKGYKEWAGEHGFDLSEASERSTASKAISGVTQESFNEMSGRVTSIQLSAYNIDETTRALRDQQAELMTHTAQMLLELQGIHGDTGGIREAVEGLRDDMTIIKSNIGTMTDKGVRMLN